jgi:hypothetical protein
MDATLKQRVILGNTIEYFDGMIGGTIVKKKKL